MLLSLPNEILLEIAVLLWAVHPRALAALSQVDHTLRAVALLVLYRILCVQQGHGIEALPCHSSYAGLGIPVLDVATFVEYLQTENHPVATVKHLHVHGVRLDIGSMLSVFATCRQLVSLWIHHDNDEMSIGASMHGLQRLDCLRDITLPMMYATEANQSLGGLSLPSVTHLFFFPVDPMDTLHVPTLDSLPNLTHLAFSTPPGDHCLERVVESNNTRGVLVHGPGKYAHPRIVYALREYFRYHRDWVKHAASWFNPRFVMNDAMGQWEYFDTVMALRERGILQRMTNGLSLAEYVAVERLHRERTAPLRFKSVERWLKAERLASDTGTSRDELVFVIDDETKVHNTPPANVKASNARASLLSRGGQRTPPKTCRLPSGKEGDLTGEHRAMTVLYRILCVEQEHGFPESFSLAWHHDGVGLPLTSIGTFLEYLEQGNHPVRTVKHLHIHGFHFDTDALLPIFSECRRLRSLWIDHDNNGMLVSVSLRGVHQLHCLRELTVPLLYATERRDAFADAVLPSVSHLSFVPVNYGEALYLPTLASFPKLSHIAFSALPDNHSVRLVVESNEELGVLVHDTSRYLHPRVVYLLGGILAPHRDWIKRAASHWTPEFLWGDIMDQWKYFDMVMVLRNRGELQPSNGLSILEYVAVHRAARLV
ncbi:hypothetical protein C8R45DRAFT_945246 [Mycena sanguinolenta]|nr:hypothetical protein C8R45DRAFT_945246 [Mycena sanguinolenta]